MSATVHLMADPFVKLYSTILESTLWWGEDVPTRLVWITLLVASDHEGIYRGTLPGLAGRARVTLEEARNAVYRLQLPDTESRTPDYEGRRIEVIPEVGYKLLNYEKYRDKRSPKQVSDASRKAEQRKADKADMSQMSPLDLRSEILDPRLEILDPDPDSEGSPEGNAPATPPPAAVAAPRSMKRTKKPLTDMPDGFSPNAQHQTIAAEEGLNLAEQFQAFCDNVAKRAAQYANWDAALREWLRRQKTFSGPSRARQSSVRNYIEQQAGKK